MAFEGDPLRILGLPQGATEAEIKRAYRRLAKQHHPDSAGEAALPRFLAIQSAYEALTGIRPAAPRMSGAREPRRPSWQADPERARSSRDGFRRRGWSADPGRRSDAGPAGGATASGASSTSAGPEPGRSGRSRGSAGAPRPGGEPRGGTASGGPEPGTRRQRGAPGSRQSPSTPRATPGSTSYDETDHEGDKAWEGATWYGASSGTYWRVNPKEYADPRKHGPEYQARARRGGPTPGPVDAGPAAPGAFEESAGPTDDDDMNAGPKAGPEAFPRGWSTTWSSASQPGERAAGWADRGWGTAAGDRPPAGGTAAAGADARDRTSGESAAQQAAAGQAATGDADPVLRTDGLSGLTFDAARPLDRLILALVGWPPLGALLAWLTGEVTGCARFSASCSQGVDLATWIAQLVVIAMLVAIPRIAAASAVGTLAVLAAAVPAAVFLSVTGGSRDQTGSALVLAVILGAAYVGGVGLVASGRARAPFRP